MKFLYGHTSQETAKVVNDYPYGFRLRCKIRYWIETSEKKNGGQRFVSQTTNPKKAGEFWNKPKASTYSPVLIMTENEDNGHIGFTGISQSIGSVESGEKLKTFAALHGDNLTDFQKKEIRTYLALNEVYSKHVSYSFEAKRSEPIPLSEIATGSARVDAMIQEEDTRKNQFAQTQKDIRKLTAYYFKQNAAAL